MGYGIFGVIELPFLFLTVIYAFRTAFALKGGAFGKGMSFLAYGFLVMAIGHLHMQTNHFFGINIFDSILGKTGGHIAWFIALVTTWGLAGYGFHLILKASKPS